MNYLFRVFILIILCSSSAFAQEESKIKHADDVETFSTLLKDGKPTVMEFHAFWCRPCLNFDPIYKEAAEKIGDKYNFVKVNIDKNEEMTAKYNIKNIPTMILFIDGEEIWRYTGIISAEEIEKAVTSLSEE